jgi:hypothetical protein
MIDAVHLIASMQPIPRGCFVSVDNGPWRYMRADGRDCCGFASGYRRVRLATAFPRYNNELPDFMLPHERGLVQSARVTLDRRRSRCTADQSRFWR